MVDRDDEGPDLHSWVPMQEQADTISLWGQRTRQKKHVNPIIPKKEFSDVSLASRDGQQIEAQKM